MFPWYFPQHNIPLLYSGMIYISVNSLEACVLAFTARTYIHVWGRYAIYLCNMHDGVLSFCLNDISVCLTVRIKNLSV